MKKFFPFFTAVLLLAGTALAQTDRFVDTSHQNRKVLLEEYTGINCPYCPSGHLIAAEIMAENPGNAFAINIHSGGLAIPNPGQLDLTTTAGDSLNKNAKVPGYPSGTLNRHIFSGSSICVDRTAWKNRAAQILKLSSYANIAAKGTLDWENRQLEVTVQIYYTENSPVSTNYLHVAMLQDNIIGTQSGGNTNPAQSLPDGRYVHNHALRAMLSGVWGVAVENTVKGSLVEKTFSYTIPESVKSIPTEVFDLHFVAFLTESKNEVINVCPVEIDHKNSPYEYHVELGGLTQMDDSICGSTAKISFNVSPHIASSPITSMTFSVESAAGVHEFEYKPETSLRFNYWHPIQHHIDLSNVNQSESVSVKLIKINEKDYQFKDSSENLITTDVIKHIGYADNADISIHIFQDRWGSDITWELAQADNGTVLASGGPYEDLSGRATKERVSNVKLAAACYVFTINDKQSDGINTRFGEGHIEINDATKTIIYNNGKYTSQWRCLIGNNAVGNARHAMRSALRLSPNPAKDYSMLKFDLPASQKVHIRIMQANGACALDLGEMNLSAGKQSVELPLGKLSEGIYFVNISGSCLNLNQKLVVIR